MTSDLAPEIRQWGMWCHLSALAGVLVMFLIPIPFLGILIPFIVWQNGRRKHPFIDEQGKESLNFQISMAIYAVVILILGVFLLFQLCGMTSNYGSSSSNAANVLGVVLVGMVGFVILMAIFQIIAVIVASVKANKGQSFRYPFTLRFLK
jgi:uncharacterized Tic20 family protein